MKVIHRGIVLYDRRKKQPDSRAQVGDVAEIGGRLVARCRFDFEDRTFAYGLRDYVAGERPDNTQAIPSPTDWSRWLDHEMNRSPGRYRVLGARDFIPADELELADFKRRSPHLAARMGLEAPEARPALFEVGETRYPYLEPGVDWRQLIDRHAAGDFGEHGTYADASLTDEETFTISQQPLALQNRAVIAAKSGPIRSRYRVPVAERVRMSTHALVDVVTVLSPLNPRRVGPRTLITCVDAEGTSRS